MKGYNAKRDSRRGILHEGHEYWVKIRDITVSDSIKAQKISERRYKREMNYWNNIGLFATRILLDRDFNLIDGYITLLIACDCGLEEVPVNFVSLRRVNRGSTL